MKLSNVIHAVDAHAAGEPGRVIVGGVLDVPGRTMFEKKRHFERHLDQLRRRMLFEPNGYPPACCNVILPSNHPEAVAGYVIMEATEYPAMSGTNTMCVATVMLETGMVARTEPVTEFALEAPAGLVRITARVENGRTVSISFRNVPAFVHHLDAEIEVPELGRVKVDIAYGGMIYVMADARQFGLSLLPREGRRITRIGGLLRQAAFEQLPCSHPENAEITGPTISMLHGPAHHPANHGRNAVIMPTGRVDLNDPDTWTGVIDRSPCGTGTCARMACLHARGELAIGDDYRHEGILDTVFTGRLVEPAEVARRPAVVPSITGRAYITAFAQYVLDEDDPFPAGYQVADLWGAGLA